MLTAATLACACVALSSLGVSALALIVANLCDAIQLYHEVKSHG